MEASSGILVDKTLYPKRNNSSVSGFHGGSINNNAFSLGSANQRFLGIHGAGAGSFGPHPPPYTAPPYPLHPPTYSSLPMQPAHPPLLPLPTSKSLSFPSPSPLPQSARVVAPPSPYSATKDQKKQRSSPANAKKDPQRGVTRPQKLPPAATPPARVPMTPAAAISAYKDRKPDGVDEGDPTNDVYALSPPPSSLPMPSFCLRARTPPALPPASCNVEAFGGGGALLSGAGADAGASDDLRRLLRL